MQVIDLRPDRMRLGQISVVASAALPETIVLISIRLPIEHFVQELRGVRADKAERLALSGEGSSRGLSSDEMRN